MNNNKNVYRSKYDLNLNSFKFKNECSFKFCVLFHYVKVIYLRLKRNVYKDVSFKKGMGLKFRLKNHRRNLF